MNKRLLHRLFLFYYDGFHQMRLGKTLWLIILVKLFIIFIVLKIFFFPDFLKSKAKETGVSEYVSGECIRRASD